MLTTYGNRVGHRDEICKIANNYGRCALAVLGPTTYLRYLGLSMALLPIIWRHRKLTAVDRAMGKTPLRVRYRKSAFIIDCAYADLHRQEDSYTFGLMREIYIRDCYFRGHPPEVLASVKSVVDLGANRGVFSTMMAAQGGFVVSIECKEAYNDVIRRNMAVNGLTNYTIQNAFMGTGGLDYQGQRGLEIEELLDQYSLKTVDFVKMDIEGSEFSLFEAPGWLRRVQYLSLEVHPEFGRVQPLLDALERHGFVWAISNHCFQQVNDPQNGSFVYARRA